VNAVAEQLTGWTSAEAMGPPADWMFCGSKRSLRQRSRESRARPVPGPAPLLPADFENGNRHAGRSRLFRERSKQGRLGSILVVQEHSGRREEMEGRLIPIARGLEAIANLAVAGCTTFNNLLMVILGCLRRVGDGS